jgi:membrane protein
MADRPLPSRLWWTVKDYAKRIWDNAGDDNISFLAGGIAFNLLLAAVPFILLLLSALGYLLNQSVEQSSSNLWQFIDTLLPPHAESANAPIHQLVNGLIQARGSFGIFGAIAFVWFSTRLFGTLRSVLGEVFDIEQGMNMIKGKLFDIQITIISTILFAIYTLLSAYLKLATTRGLAVVNRLGIRTDVMGQLEYWLGSAIAAGFLLLMFFALYKFLPNRRIRWKSAMIGAVWTSVLFELAKHLFTTYLSRFNPGSLYTGTLYALVIIVFWVYYAALIFILGGEIGRVYELRHARRLQRETFEG